VTSIKRQAKGSINLAKCLYPSIPCALGTYRLHKCSFLGLETTVAGTGDMTRVPLVTLNWVTDMMGRVSPSSRWITSIWLYGEGFPPPSSYRTKSHRCDRKASASLSRQITLNKHDKEGFPPHCVELSHIDMTGFPLPVLSIRYYVTQQEGFPLPVASNSIEWTWRGGKPSLSHWIETDTTGRGNPPHRIKET